MPSPIFVQELIHFLQRYGFSILAAMEIAIGIYNTHYKHHPKNQYNYRHNYRHTNKYYRRN